MKKRLKQKVRGMLQSLVSSTFKAPAVGGARNVDPYVHALLAGFPRKEQLNDPASFVGLLRESFLPYRTGVKEIKRTALAGDASLSRFGHLLETLKTAMPPLRAPSISSYTMPVIPAMTT